MTRDKTSLNKALSPRDQKRVSEYIAKHWKQEVETNLELGHSLI